VRILIIEDKKKTAAFLAKGLREAGFRVEIAGDDAAGLNRPPTAQLTPAISRKPNRNRDSR
jgi:DNA-binding response OmpR family regulator